MSIQGVAWAMRQELPCCHKMVLMWLGEHANEYKICWPSQATLALECGLSRQKVNYCIAELEEWGYISVSPRTRKNGADSSNEYRILMPDEELRPTEPKVQQGHIYVATLGSRSKVGITRDVARRLKAMSGAVGHTVDLYNSVPMPMADARRLERSVLAMFEDYRSMGEWLTLPPEEVWGAVISGVNSIDTTVSPALTGGVNHGDTHKEPLQDEPQLFSDENKKTRAPAVRNPSWPENAFEVFYRAYPHKVGKAAAAKAFGGARKRHEAKVPFEVFMDGLTRYITTKPHDRPWCNPSTWLNQDRFQDEPASVMQNGSARRTTMLDLEMELSK